MPKNKAKKDILLLNSLKGIIPEKAVAEEIKRRELKYNKHRSKSMKGIDDRKSK